MNKESFASCFRESLETACSAAEKSLGKKLSRDVIIKMYGAGENGLEVSPAEFLERAYISEESFYRLIDLMVVEIVGSRPVLFAKISGHPPAPISMSWNGAKGPFKQLQAGAIVQR